MNTLPNNNLKMLVTDFLIDKLHVLDTPFGKTHQKNTTENPSDRIPKKRNVEVLVISDVHLGASGSNAKELYNYLQSISPKKVILNGDIIDMWLFSKSYWPSSHMLVVKQLLSYLSKDVEVLYITGNHDEFLRKFEGFELGQLKIVNQHDFVIDGKKIWAFHGDVFDITMKHSKWLAKAGAWGYDFLIILNRWIDKFLIALGRPRISLSKRIKNSVKGAVKFIDDFENVVTQTAIEKGYDYVLCGHIHQPTIKQFTHQNKTISYLNSGDWVENLTALEYNNGEWKLYNYKEDQQRNDAFTEITEPSLKELFSDMAAEFSIT